MAATSGRLRGYNPASYPLITNDPSFYISKEADKISEAISTLLEVVKALDTTATLLKNAVNDAAAAAAGVPIGGLYHNSGAVRVRLT